MAEEILRNVGNRLKVRGRRRERVIRELRSHLDESRHQLVLTGHSPDEALRESLESFGDPEDVADMLTAVHRRRPRLAMVVAATMLLTAASAWFGASGTFASGPHRAVHHPRAAATHGIRCDHTPHLIR